MTGPKAWRLLLSCEHGGNQIPPEFRIAFINARKVLSSHRGWDQGALAAARVLKRELQAPLIATEVSRLVVDCNRSSHNPKAFSSWSRAFDQRALLKRYHIPYWRKVRARLKIRTLHVSVHSFTPVFHGYVRPTDIGILFDSRRPLEVRFATAFRRELRREFPKLKIHFNLPYRGRGDGLTTSLRAETAPEKYLGLEIEFNQRLWRRHRVRDVAAKVARALAQAKVDFTT